MTNENEIAQFVLFSMCEHAVSRFDRQKLLSTKSSLIYQSRIVNRDWWISFMIHICVRTVLTNGAERSKIIYFLIVIRMPVFDSDPIIKSGQATITYTILFSLIYRKNYKFIVALLFLASTLFIRKRWLECQMIKRNANTAEIFF